MKITRYFVPADAGSFIISNKSIYQVSFIREAVKNIKRGGVSFFLGGEDHQ